MDELIMPLEGKDINGLSIRDKSRLADKVTKIIEEKGYNPFTLNQIWNGGVE